MAVYKKRGYKPKKEKVVDEVVEETFDETESSVAEAFNTLDETANKSEEWIEKNSKPLLYGLVAVASVLLVFLLFNKFVSEFCKFQNDLRTIIEFTTIIDVIYNKSMIAIKYNYCKTI